MTDIVNLVDLTSLPFTMFNEGMIEGWYVKCCAVYNSGMQPVTLKAGSFTGKLQLLKLPSFPLGIT